MKNYTGYKAEGITRDVDTCDCCGRVDLKKTVMMRFYVDNEPEQHIEYFGTTCASKCVGNRTGKKVTARQVQEEAEAAQREVDQGDREVMLAWKRTQIESTEPMVKQFQQNARQGEKFIVYRYNNVGKRWGAEFPPFIFQAVMERAFLNAVSNNQPVVMAQVWEKQGAFAVKVKSNPQTERSLPLG